MLREKIVIPLAMPFITFLGDSYNPPTITGNDTASTKGNDGNTLNTFHSATVAVNSNYFVAINIIFEVILQFISFRFVENTYIY